MSSVLRLGVVIEVDDTDAFARNPLRFHDLVELAPPEGAADWEAAHVRKLKVANPILDECVLCHEGGFGELCDRHVRELRDA